jgi:hypothetical protein
VRNIDQNAALVTEAAVALATRLRDVAVTLENGDTVQAVFFTRDVERKGNQLRTVIEVTLVEQIS